MNEPKYNLYVSHSCKDAGTVARIVNKIHTASSARCIATGDVALSLEQINDDPDRIVAAICNTDMFLFVMSDNSLASEVCMMEVLYAANTGKKIIPVVIDGKGLRGWFLSECGQMYHVDINDPGQYNAFLKDLNSYYADDEGTVVSIPPVNNAVPLQQPPAPPAFTPPPAPSSRAVNSCESPFPNEIEYKANFNDGMYSIGGKIIITPTQLIFRAHGFNFGDLSDRVFNISSIVGYRKGFLTFMNIDFADGSSIKLTVWKKQEIIDQLEKRKKYLEGRC
jgi:hypothetical protein